MPARTYAAFLFVIIALGGLSLMVADMVAGLFGIVWVVYVAPVAMVLLALALAVRLRKP